MEDRGGQNRIGSCPHGGCEVLELACTTGCDERNRDVRANVADQLEVEALLGAVGVHGVQQDFTHTAVLGFTHPFEGVQARSLLAAVSCDLVA